MSNTNETPSSEKFLGGRWSTAYAAFGFLIVVVLASVFLVVTLNSDKDTGTASPGGLPGNFGVPSNAVPSNAVPSNAVPSNAVPSNAVPPAPEQKSLTAAPQTAWCLLGSLALPSSPEAGPAKADGVIATGYQRSPTGALFALANASYRFVLAGDEVWEQATDAMMAPGPGNDIWRELRSTHLSGPTNLNDDEITQIAGFNFLSYNQDRAVIALATRDSNGRYQQGTYQMVWLQDDWKLELTDQGKFTVSSGEIPSLAGFIAWQGVS